MMTKFIQSTTFFLSVLLICILGPVELSEYLISKKAAFKLDKSPEYLVLGHSHSECAFNDSLIGGLKNLSHSGEAYYYTYFKVKKVIEQNPSVKVIFIEFTNNQTFASFDTWIWKSEFLNERYRKYSAFMDFSDKMILVRNNPVGFINSSGLAFVYNSGRILLQKFDYSRSVGGYQYLKQNRLTA